MFPCSKQDEQLDKYGFLRDMKHTFSFLDGYDGISNGNPKDYIPSGNEPAVLQYYAVELNHAMKRALYCIVS